MPLLPADPQRLGRGDADILEIGHRREDVACESVAVGGLSRTAGRNGNENVGLQDGARGTRCVGIAQYHRAPWGDSRNVKSGKLADFERQKTKLFVHRNGSANRQCRQRGADHRVWINRLRRLRDLHRDERGQGGRGGHQNPFANFYLVDLLVSQHQKCIAGGKRHRLPRLERQTLLFERIGSDGLLQI